MKNFLEKTSILIRKTNFKNILSFLRDIIFFVISLFIGTLMASRSLTLEIVYIPSFFTIILGWFIILTTIIFILLKFFD
ncbi:MAG: hypothetical protein QW103_00010 [Candidatus Pacearchaeota archaeon]